MLEFNPKKLRIFTQDQIIALLRHEIMHPITMQESSKVFVEALSPGLQEIEMEVQYAYDELINYKEYVKLFPNDSSLHSAKDKQFSDFSCGLLNTKYQMGLKKLDPIKAYMYALILYEGAVYYFFEDKQKLEQWIKKHQCYALYEFLKWIHDDFDFIHEHTQTRDEMRSVILLIAKMILTVSVEEMFLSNKLSFDGNFDSELKQCKTRYTNKLGQDLLERWKNQT